MGSFILVMIDLILAITSIVMFSKVSQVVKVSLKSKILLGIGLFSLFPLLGLVSVFSIPVILIFSCLLIDLKHELNNNEKIVPKENTVYNKKIDTIKSEKSNNLSNNSNDTFDSIMNKLKYINYVATRLDDNDMGFQSFARQEDPNYTSSGYKTNDLIRYNLLTFINYILNGDISNYEFSIISKYNLNSIVGRTFLNPQMMKVAFDGQGKSAPTDWSIFYLRKSEINNLIADKKYEDAYEELKTIYDYLGKLMVNSNPSKKAVREKRFDEYWNYLESEFEKTRSLNEVPLTNTINDNVKKEEVKIDSKVDKKTLDELVGELNDLIGLENVKEDVNSLINLIKVRKIREDKKITQQPMSLHLVFTGNPGTGKTTVARIIAQIYYKLGVLSKGTFFEVDRSELVGGYVGQTAIKVKEMCQKSLGGILFIDEAYMLSQNKDSNDFGKEAIDTLLKFMEDHRDDFIVIVAGYTNEMESFLDSNPGLKSRFNKYIFFDDYNPDELLSIFNKLCRDSELIVDDEVNKFVHDYFEERYENKKENFANARDVRNFFEKAISNQANRISKDNLITTEELQRITIDDVKNIKLRD